MTCELCQEPLADCLCFETCTTCGEKAYIYPRCRECRATDETYLHDKQRIPYEPCTCVISDDAREGRWAA